MIQKKTRFIIAFGNRTELVSHEVAERLRAARAERTPDFVEVETVGEYADTAGLTFEVNPDHVISMTPVGDDAPRLRAA